MESVGKILREARSRLGLTLEQVSAQTRITLKNLAAIEADDLSRISSPFFYRSFVRQFAAAVKLDYDSIAAAVQDMVSTMPEPLVPGQEDAPVIHVAAIKPGHSRSFRWLRSVFSFSLVMAACTGMYAMWQDSHSDWRHLVSDLAARVQHVRATVMPSTPQSQPATQVKAADFAGSEAVIIPEKPVSSEFHVQLAALERTWLSIVADGKEVFSGILDESETKVLQGRESARIKTGNAGGLIFTFNGKQIGVLGPRGQVRTVVFTKDNYKVLPSTSEVAFNLLIQNVD
jgi:cytoskeletal protein RodZ